MNDFGKSDELRSPRGTYEPPRLRELGTVAELTQRNGESVLDSDPA